MPYYHYLFTVDKFFFYSFGEKKLYKVKQKREKRLSVEKR